MEKLLQLIAEYHVKMNTKENTYNALQDIAEAIRDLKPKHEPQLYEIEACQFDNEDENISWIAVFFKVLVFIGLIVSLYLIVH